MMPWVYKMRKDRNVACEIYIYVDDGRLTGFCKLECWRAARRFCAICNTLGMQDSASKRTEPSMTQGPWAGTVTHTDNAVVATVMGAKWRKTKEMIAELDMMEKSGKLEHKRLEQIQGFLIYVSCTFRWMAPHLKGLNLTIDSWCPRQDEWGWKKKAQSKQHIPVEIEG
jgi:hypothetical protein